MEILNVLRILGFIFLPLGILLLGLFFLVTTKVPVKKLKALAAEAKAAEAAALEEETANENIVRIVAIRQTNTDVAKTLSELLISNPPVAEGWQCSELKGRCLKNALK